MLEVIFTRMQDSTINITFIPLEQLLSEGIFTGWFPRQKQSPTLCLLIHIPIHFSLDRFPHL